MAQAVPDRGCRLARRGIAPPPPPLDSPLTPMLCSLVWGSLCPLPPRYLAEGVYSPLVCVEVARFVPTPSPPVAFQAGACGWGGIPNPAMTHPLDNAGAKPPDKGHFSVSTLA